MGACEIKIILDSLNPEHECPAAIRTKDNTEIEDGGIRKIIRFHVIQRLENLFGRGRSIQQLIVHIEYFLYAF